MSSIVVRRQGGSVRFGWGVIDGFVEEFLKVFILTFH